MEGGGKTHRVGRPICSKVQKGTLSPSRWALYRLALQDQARDGKGCEPQLKALAANHSFGITRVQRENFDSSGISGSCVTAASTMHGRR